MASSVARISAKRAVLWGTASAATGGTAYLALSNDENVRGFRRQARFWSKVLPVAADYYWHLGQKSPYVLYHTKWKNKVYSNSNSNSNDTSVNTVPNDLPSSKAAVLPVSRADLDAKHAQTILEVMTELRGLYIKLGQVLSVTALPVPEAYRAKFRSLQSDVSGYDFDEFIRPLLEKELCQSKLGTGVDGDDDSNKNNRSRRTLDDLFESIDPVPCGAASIGQAHKAKRRDSDGGKDVILKVQYPDASWQVPADIRCIGDLLRLLVWAGTVDESAARLSFDDFSQQFLAELDYGAELDNLRTIHESSLDPHGPYARHGVIVPAPVEELCAPHVLAMTYLPGPKLEEEAHRQLRMLGIDTKRNVKDLVRDEMKGSMKQKTVPFSGLANENDNDDSDDNDNHGTVSDWRVRVATAFTNTVGLNNLLRLVRWFERALWWSTSVAVHTIEAAPSAVVPTDWSTWAKEHQTAAEQASRLSLTESWIDALLDVHGHQIFQLGLFNADPHPGNILVLEDPDTGATTKELGLIDFGQCKRLSVSERAAVARLVVAVSDDRPDQEIADAFRGLGVKTRKDSTEFLSKFAKLMFGSLRPEHLDHDWHKRMHKMDRVIYFPTELSMVYRTALLLRGLALSLRINSSISDHWKSHAVTALAEFQQQQEQQEQEQQNVNEGAIGMIAGNDKKPPQERKEGPRVGTAMSPTVSSIPA